MADGEALPDGGAGPGVPVVDVKVGAADAGGENADFDVVDTHLGLGNVLEPKAAFFAAFYQCLHLKCLSCCRLQNVGRIVAFQKYWPQGVILVVSKRWC